MKKKIISMTMALMILIAGTVFGLEGIQNSKLENNVLSENLASTYTTYESHFNKLTAIPEHTYKDVYSTSSSQRTISYDQRFQYVNSYQGPTPMTFEETVTSGITRTSSFSGNISSNIVQMTLDHSYETSSSKSVTQTFTFPGDNRLHTLYTTRRHIEKEGKSSRTSHIAYPVSYTYIYLVASWDVVWGGYERYPSRDILSHKTNTTTEYHYGNYMTQ